MLASVDRSFIYVRFAEQTTQFDISGDKTQRDAAKRNRAVAISIILKNCYHSVITEFVANATVCMSAFRLFYL